MHRSFLRAASLAAFTLSFAAITSPALAESTRIESDRATLTTNPNTVGEGVLQGELGLEVGIGTYRGRLDGDPGLEADSRPFDGSLLAKYGLFDNLDIELSVVSSGEARRASVELSAADGSVDTATSDETAHVLTTVTPGVKVKFFELDGISASLSLGLSAGLASPDYRTNMQTVLAVEWDHDFLRARANVGTLAFESDGSLGFDPFISGMISARLLAMDEQRVDLFAEASLEPIGTLVGSQREMFAWGLLFQLSKQLQLDLTARFVSFEDAASEPVTFPLLGVGVTLRR